MASRRSARVSAPAVRTQSAPPRLERIELFQLHRIDPRVPLDEQVGELKLLQDEGKIGHIGLSEVDVQQLTQAQQTAPIASVQNLYNLSNRGAEPLLQHVEASDVAFIPWFPLADSKLSAPGRPLEELSKELDATPPSSPWPGC